MRSIDTFNTQRKLNINQKTYTYFSLPALQESGVIETKKLPHTLRILLENLLRHEDGQTVTVADIEALQTWLKNKKADHEIAYRPGRVLMQDFTGVPAVVDLAAMRDTMQKLGGDANKINPLSPVDLVIDHSVQVDSFAKKEALSLNNLYEMQRNAERYDFLRWGQQAFTNFRVVPPDTGICHQVNLEYLAKTIWHSKSENGDYVAYPDTLVGTDSHTTMVNGLGVLGWGVGGIEAEAAMLGQPISMLIPEVVGVKLINRLPDGVTATDLVLFITELLRKKEVVGKFVEYFGPGVAELHVSDRATLANMAPEYGATCGFFPIDQLTLDYLHLTGRDTETLDLVGSYAKAQQLWVEADDEIIFSDVIEIDLSKVCPAVSGPKRPQDRISLTNLKQRTIKLANDFNQPIETAYSTSANYQLHPADLVLAAITSCTNTSNPNVLMAAGLVAKKAVEKGLKRKPWVKTSLAPGSKVVTEYLIASGLQPYLDQLGFNLVGYGCTTCIGNSGPLLTPVANTVQEKDLLVSSILSGNRNFEGRIHPQVKANWLASPPLVVVFALTGTTAIDLTSEAIGTDPSGNPVFLKDIWPSHAEVAQEVAKVSSSSFKKMYRDVFKGNEDWQNMTIHKDDTYNWRSDSTYIQPSPFFNNLAKVPGKIEPVKNARILALLGDMITTDHISPAGSIKEGSPASRYLNERGISPENYNSYGARRGNHEIMMRGTFANIRIRNEIVAPIEGGVTRHFPTEEIMTIYDAAMRYQQEKIPLIVIAGKAYGAGSSRDWAAKGPKLLGVKAVLAESFERIHRSNLIGMGILPLQFMPGENRLSWQFSGSEIISLPELNDEITPKMKMTAVIKKPDGSQCEIQLLSRIDTKNEIIYYKHGGILHYVLRTMLP